MYAEQSILSSEPLAIPVWRAMSAFRGRKHTLTNGDGWWLGRFFKLSQKFALGALGRGRRVRGCPPDPGMGRPMGALLIARGSCTPPRATDTRRRPARLLGLGGLRRLLCSAQESRKPSAGRPSCGSADRQLESQAAGAHRRGSLFYSS